MTPERARQIQNIYRQAVVLPEDERRLFLRDACAGDEDLRHEVQQKLAAHSAETLTLKESANPPHLVAGDPPAKVIGAIIGRYTILGQLGAGGMGVVYRGRDEQLRRDVAIKVLPAPHWDDSVARARLLREARAAASLNHPSICTIYEVGEAHGQVYIAMELVEGRALSQLLAERGLLSEDLIIHYALQLTDALGHAHERGIVHHDLKTANVIVTPEGRCKVLDFGLAKRMGSEGIAEGTTLTALTETGALTGTPAYMPPELLRGQATDARGDVWALGVMLYEAAAGERPFKGNTPFELTSAILNQELPPLPGSIPLVLRNVIERCLEKDPEKRYGHGRDVHAALEAIKTGDTTVLAAWLSGRRRRRYALGIGVFALAVALTVGLAVLNPGGVRDKLASFVSTARVETVAVLPLDNHSGDPEQDYLADGMTDALITSLSKFGSLKRVIGYRSVMRYKNTQLPLQEIARQLNVASLITGSVIRSEDRVSVNIQLIKPSTGEQVWADSYQRGWKDRLTLQNDVLRAITEQLRVRLTEEEKAELAQSRPVNPEAVDAYRNGMAYWHKHTAEDVERAEKYFQLALEKDPEYIDAYVGLGWVLVYFGTATMSSHEVLAAWRKIEQKIRDLDPTQNVRRGLVEFYYEWDWAGAEKGFKYGIELKPNAADSFMFYWEFLSSMKRIREAGEVVERCLDLDPLNPLSQDSKGRYLIYARRYDDAIAWFKEFIKNGSDFGVGSMRLWTAYHHKGMQKEAFEQAVASFAGIPEIQQVLNHGYREAGYPGAMRLLADAMAKGPSAHKLCPNIARLYTYAGDKESALTWLEQAYDERDSGLVQIQIDPDWETLHAEPRFQSLVQRMKFPQSE